jgi:hypothetical protein
VETEETARVRAEEEGHKTQARMPGAIGSAGMILPGGTPTAGMTRNGPKGTAMPRTPGGSLQPNGNQNPAKAGGRRTGRRPHHKKLP